MISTDHDHDTPARGDKLADEEVAPAPPDRTTYLGGSDIAAIVGVSPYLSALEVFGRKLGRLPESPTNDAMDLGNRLESAVARMYADREGVALHKGRWIPGPRQFLGGTPDYEIEAKRRGLEVKTAGIITPWSVSDEWGDDDSDQVPEHYALQCHWYMALTGFGSWDLAALIGGRGYAVFRLNRDAELCSWLLSAAAKFWADHIVAKLPPSPDGSSSAREALSKLWPRERKPLIRATPDVERVALAYRAACEAFDAAQATKDEAEAKVKALVADAEGIEGDGWRVTWKAPKPSLKVDMEQLQADPAGALLCDRYRKSVENARRIHKNWNTNPKED